MLVLGLGTTKEAQGLYKESGHEKTSLLTFCLENLWVVISQQCLDGTTHNNKRRCLSKIGIRFEQQYSLINMLCMVLGEDSAREDYIPF